MNFCTADCTAVTEQTKLSLHYSLMLSTHPVNYILSPNLPKPLDCKDNPY